MADSVDEARVLVLTTLVIGTGHAVALHHLGLLGGVDGSRQNRVPTAKMILPGESGTPFCGWKLLGTR